MKKSKILQTTDQIAGWERDLDSIKNQLLDWLVGKIKEVVPLLVENGVILDQSQATKDPRLIARIKERLQQSLQNLKLELQNGIGPIHWQESGQRVVRLVGGMGDGSEKNVLEIGFRLFVGAKCVEILAPFGLSNGLVTSTAEPLEFLGQPSYSIPKGSAYYWGVFAWTFRQVLLLKGASRMESLILEKERLQHRIAQLRDCIRREEENRIRELEIESRKRLWKE